MLPRLLALLALVAGALVFACAAAAYGWPVRPFDAQHPIRGFFGDPRTVFDQALTNDGVDGPGSFSFHNGVDIAAPNDTAVYPVVGGIAHLIDGAAVSVRTFDGRTFQYFHIIPAVVDGERVFPRLSVLGFIQAPYAHVHLSELDGDRITNPLLRGHLDPYADRTKPQIAALELRDPAGMQAAPATVCGRLTLEATAFDTPPLPVPGTFAGMPVAPAVLSWRLSTPRGLVVVAGRDAVDFRHTLPPPREFWKIYARGSYQNAPRFGREQFPTMQGRYLYRLGTLQTALLPNGPYRLTVTAADERGNTVTDAQPFSIANVLGSCASTPAPVPSGQVAGSDPGTGL